jgi:hydroxymethylglutaryl-CoA reductase
MTQVREPTTTLTIIKETIMNKNGMLGNGGSDTTAVVAATGATLEQQVASNIGIVLDDSQQRLAERLPLDQRGLIGTLFDPIAKQRRKGELRIQELELSHQVRQLGLIREVEAQTLRTVLSHFLKEGKLGLQGRTAAYAQARADELLGRVEETIKGHQARVKDAWQRAEELPEPLQDEERQRILRGYKRVVADVEVILQQYSEIVQEVLPDTRN